MRILTIAALLSLVAVACGQLPGTHTDTTRTTGSRGFLEEEVVTEEGTEGRAGRTVTREGEAAGDGGAGTDSDIQPRGDGGAQVEAGPGDTTGVTDNEVVIGVHAPLTGAAPVESEAFQKGKDLYFRYEQEVVGEDFAGRTVKVIFRDDQYNPSTAQAVCKQMAREAFLLVGGAGTDQIQACARFAEENGIPYLSAGVTEVGVGELSTYFTLSASYPAQSPIIAELIYNSDELGDLDQWSPNGVPQPDGEVKVAFVAPESPNFDDQEEAFRAALENLGQDLDFSARTPKENSPNLNSAVAQIVSRMKQEGIDVVDITTAPVITINLVQQGESQAYLPRYVGPGITNGLNQVSNILCGDKGESAGFHQASFFSPFPGWPEVMQGRFDPNFADAAERFASDSNNVESGGDILLAFYGLGKNVGTMLREAGRDITRSGFIQMLSNNYSHETGLLPPISYAPNDHFGVDQAHRLEADCTTDNAFHQRNDFVSGY